MAEETEETTQPFEIRFENALERRHPYTFPGVIIAIGFAFFFIFWSISLNDILTNHPTLDPFVLLDYPVDLGLDYWTATVIFFAFILSMMFAVYIVALIPLTLFIVLGSKSMFAFGLSQDIAKTGTKFGGIQLVLRSMLPGLFGIGFGVGALPYLISLTTAAPSTWPLSFTLITALYFGSLGLIIGMALFPATWFTDDAGLVIQGLLKTPYRAPPKVDGAGNWLRVVFAGLTVFLYPLTMILNFILIPFNAGHLSLLDLAIGVFVIVIGLPLVMMGMSLPFVLLTEKLQPKIVNRIRSMAFRIGAKEIEFQEPKPVDEIMESKQEEEN